MGMQFMIDVGLLPATLTSAPMCDREFADFCAEHPDLRFEMTAEGEIIVTPPTFTTTGLRNSQICRQLGNWAEKDGRGFAPDSSAGYLLPNGARRSPDASWTRNEQIRALPETSRDGFWHLCPAFVIELRSQSDRLPVLREKMREYLENGAELGWLIDPETRTVEVYRPNRDPEVMTGVDSVTGEGPVDGFVLDLRKVWDPFSS
jgi:Uma2 family endonuclease